MMMAKEESQEMERQVELCSTSDHISSLPHRINKPNKLIILLLHQVLVMVSLHLEELTIRVDVTEPEPARVDVLTSTYEQQEVQRRTRRGGQNQRDATAHQNRREMKRFLFWLEKLMHFDKVYNDVQLVCPGKLVFKKVRLHGSHWQKAHHCFHMDALQR